MQQLCGMLLVVTDFLHIGGKHKLMGQNFSVSIPISLMARLKKKRKGFVWNNSVQRSN